MPRADDVRLPAHVDDVALVQRSGQVRTAVGQHADPVRADPVRAAQHEHRHVTGHPLHRLPDGEVGERAERLPLLRPDVGDLLAVVGARRLPVAEVAAEQGGDPGDGHRPATAAGPAPAPARHQGCGVGDRAAPLADRVDQPDAHLVLVALGPVGPACRGGERRGREAGGDEERRRWAPPADRRPDRVEQRRRQQRARGELGDAGVQGVAEPDAVQRVLHPRWRSTFVTTARTAITGLSSACARSIRAMSSKGRMPGGVAPAVDFKR